MNRQLLFMHVLAIETTTSHGSVALLDDEQLLTERPLEAQHYSRQLLPALSGLLQEHRLSLASVGLFAVASGPGSFTGCRVGLTAVKGLIEVLQAPAVPVSTLQAIASFSGGGSAMAALDAARGEVYWGRYAADPSLFWALPEQLRTDVGEEGLETVDAWAARLAASSEPCWTPHAQLTAALAATGASAATLERLRAAPERLAPAVGRVGLRLFRAGYACDALQLDARYLRRSDAEIFSAPKRLQRQGT